jgi:hypothetical protein
MKVFRCRDGERSLCRAWKTPIDLVNLLVYVYKGS